MSTVETASPAPASVTSHERLIDILVLVAAGLLVGLPFLGQEEDWSSREVRHALIAAEMAARGEYLVPYLLGQQYIYKPPVMHIPMIALYKLAGGPSMFLARLVSVLAGIAGCIALYVFARYFYERRTALLASLMLLGSVGEIRIMRTARPDMCFSAAIMTACALVVWGMSKKGFGRRALPLFLAGAAFGVANLSKGPYGLFYGLFPMAVVLFGPMHKRELIRPKLYEWPLVLLGFAAIPMAWMLPVFMIDQGAYLRSVFGQYDPATEHVRGFFWYSLNIAPIMLLPWTLFFPGYVWQRAKKRSASESAAGKTNISRFRAPLVVAAVTLLALSLVGGKREHYLGPWFPFMMLELACEVSRLFSLALWRRVASSVIALGLLAPALYYGLVFPYVLKGSNPEGKWAMEVVDALPDQAGLICFRDMAEEVAWEAHVRRWKRLPDLYVSADNTTFVAQVERLWREGKPCFALVREKDMAASVDKLANARIETVCERIILDAGPEFFRAKEDAVKQTTYRLYKIANDPVSEKIATN